MCVYVCMYAHVCVLSREVEHFLILGEIKIKALETYSQSTAVQAASFLQTTLHSAKVRISARDFPPTACFFGKYLKSSVVAHGSAINKTPALTISVSVNILHNYKLTHWGWVTQKCVGNLTIIGKKMASSPVGTKPLYESMLEYC